MKAIALAACVCLSVSTAWAGPLKDVRVLNDRAPDCRSLKSIVASVTRGCTTDDEKVIAIYNFCRFAYYHHAYPNEEGGISALKMLHVYGWGLCGGQHSVMAALWDAAGYQWRYRGWSNPGHTTVEVYYGGRWHYLDTFLKFYCWMPDPANPKQQTIAGQEDIRANPALVTDGFVLDQARSACYAKDNRFEMIGEKANWTAPAFMVCGDDLPGLLSGIRSSNNAGSPRGWAGISFDDPNYVTDVNLAPGFALTLDWSHVDDAWYFRGSKDSPRHSCGDKDYRNCPSIGPLTEPYAAQEKQRSWSNGTLLFRPDLSTQACLQGFAEMDNVAWEKGQLKPKDAKSPASLAVEMASPYVVAKASAEVASEGVQCEFSADGKSWKKLELAALSEAAQGSYRYLVRFTFQKPITALALTSTVQHNREMLPYLAPGRNTITITAADGAKLDGNRLAVTYAYCPGVRNATPEELCDRGAEIARAHAASWATEPIVVQKIIDKLPCTFTIDIATPKDKQPVYPRMLFLRREVLSPGELPMPTPVEATVPAVKAGEELKTLPNPWTLGTHAPAKAPPRPTTSAALPPAKVSYASKQGETAEHQFIKWLKDDSDAWVMLVGVDAEKLPPADRFAGAKLVLYVTESHDKAPMQVAAVTLDAPFEPGKPFDFAKLGQQVGTAIVEKGNGPGAPFSPPRKYEIDVTRAVRAWIRGDAKCNGLAVRIVPTRSIDDGWTVRFTPAKDKPCELELSTYK